MNLSKAEIKELATILTFDSVQQQADKLREVGEHHRADVLWNIQTKICDEYGEQYDEEQAIITEAERYNAQANINGEVGE